MFVQLYNVASNRSVVRDQLDSQLSDCQDIPSFYKLPDNTWELVVYRLYVSELRQKLKKKLPSYYLNTVYNPIEPSISEIKHCRSCFIV